jgi:hypothetical protein
MSGKGTEDGDKQRSTGLCGWDAEGEQLVETWHVSDGLYAVIRYPIKSMTKDAWPGDFTVTFADGKTYDGTCTLNIEDQGFTWVARWEQDGKQMVRKGVASRMKSK